MTTSGASDAELTELVLAFGTSLRMGRGIDDAQVSEVKDQLARAARAYSGDEMMRRRTAGVLAELVPGIEASSYLYPRADAERIRDLAMEIQELLLPVFYD